MSDIVRRKFWFLISILLLSLALLCVFSGLVINNRICFDNSSYVSDMDYMMYAYHDAFPEKKSHVLLIDEVYVGYVNNAKLEKYKATLISSVDGSNSLRVRITSNNTQILWMGKNLQMAKGKYQYYMLFSPCGKKLSSTQ